MVPGPEGAVYRRNGYVKWCVGELGSLKIGCWVGEGLL